MSDAKKQFTISARSTGLVLGTYVGKTEAEALDAMARDAGYIDFDAASDVAGGSSSDFDVVEERRTER